MYSGARCQKFVPAKSIKRMLCVVIVFTAFKYVSEYLGSHDRAVPHLPMVGIFCDELRAM